MNIGIFDKTQSIGFVIMTITGLLFLFGSAGGYILGAMLSGNINLINNPPSALLPNYITMPCCFGFFIGFYLIFREEKKNTEVINQ